MKAANAPAIQVARRGSDPSVILLKRQRVQRLPSDRRAAAATELAVCLPLLTLVVFGSIQACNLIYLKHGAVTAAYEGTLELAKRNATSASIVARAQQVLDARGVRNAEIRITPGTEVNGTLPGTQFTVEVTAPVRPNMSLSGFFPLPRNVTGRVAATR
jgi:Flp pilus assembly protein TadG